MFFSKSKNKEIELKAERAERQAERDERKAERAELDAIRDELGTYINVEAFENHALFTVERVYIPPQTNTERTQLKFINKEGKLVETEVFCGRNTHRNLVNKLNNIKAKNEN